MSQVPRVSPLPGARRCACLLACACAFCKGGELRGCQRPQPIPRVSGMLGLNKPSARNKPFFLFRFENTFGYGAPGADAALHSPSGEGCRLGFLAPKTPSKVGQTAPSKGHTLKQTRRLGGENHSPGGKHVKAIAVLPFQTLAREQKHFFFPSGFREKQRVKSPADLC